VNTGTPSLRKEGNASLKDLNLLFQKKIYQKKKHHKIQKNKEQNSSFCKQAPLIKLSQKNVQIKDF